MLPGWAIDYLSGVAGGVAVVIIGHPFDTTKVLLQTAPQGMYKGTVDCVNQTWRVEGFKGFYTGVGSPLLGQMFFRATSFMTFHATLQHLNNLSSTSSTSNLFIAGGITGLAISLIETPIDLCKTKLQVQIFAAKQQQRTGMPTIAPPYNSLLSCVRHMMKAHGPTALFQGLSATIIRNVPANTLFFPVNELMKQRLVDRRNNAQSARHFTTNDLSLPERLISGACGGVCYWVLTYPLDAIKGKIMGAPFEAQHSWRSAASGIYASYGLRGFVRGIVPCAARSLPACASLFTVQDLVKLRLTELGL